ncbi:hypothetical protein [Blastococcus jejuensis]
MPSGDAGNAMRLGDYVDLVRRQWVPVLLCLMLGVGAAIAYLQLTPREYRSTTSVLVTAIDDVSGGSGRTTSINLDTEAQLVTATGTVADAAERLGVPDEARSLAGQVAVSVPPNTEILDIAFTGGTPEEAQQGSLAFAEAYLSQRQETAEDALQAERELLQARIDAVGSQLSDVLEASAALPADSPTRNRLDSQATSLNNQLANLSAQQNEIESTAVRPGVIVNEPPLPSSPSSPNALVAIAAGVLMGLLLGLGVAALRYRADDVIRTSDDLFRRTRVPVTAVLSGRLHGNRVTVPPPLSADGRGYARLRNLVSSSLEESSRRVVLVAGVRRGGGPTATNLAASLARSGEDVVLVCADVFGDTAASLFDEPPSVGLAEVLAGEQQVDAAVRRLDGVPGLRVLAPGRDPDRADALLQTRSPRKLVDRLLESATYVVIEAPPTTDSPDAQTLANVAELAVLFVEAGSTTAREVLDACAQLESMGTPVLGAVLGRYGRDVRDEPDRTRRPEDDDEPVPGVPLQTLDADRSPSEVVDPPASTGATSDSSGVVPPSPRNHAPR